MDQLRLASFRVERRSVAVAIFVDHQLDYTETRQLPNDSERASASLTGFINWVLDSFRVDLSAIELIDSGLEIRRAELTKLTIAILREEAIPISEVTKLELFTAFGVPALTSRKELRECAASIWPILTNSQAGAGILDAAALGAYIETDRLFNH
jgi:hypothetical protein